MSNMSYCRFQNTLNDLKDCSENMDSDNLSKDESRARNSLIALCCDIAIDHCQEVDKEIEEI